jgi:DNA-binding response OmpR family regulator
MSSDEKRPLGKILLQRKLVSQAELDAALTAQKKNADTQRRPLASHLTDSGAIAEIEALRALSEQHGVPGIDMLQVAILLEHLDVVPREVAESHRIMPVLVRGDRIFLGMADPTDKRVIDELEFVTGKKVYAYIALLGTLERTIASAYDAKARGEMYYLAPNVPAETLKQLGIDPPTNKHNVASPRVSDDKPPSMPPPAPHPIVDDAMARAGEDAEVSTSEFGLVPAEESTVDVLPTELRARAGQAAASMGTGAGKLVLIVDDEEEIRKLLKRVLTDKGFRVLEADRGLLALRLVKEHVPDLIILDAMLPEIHGFDIARRIKGSDKYGRIPVVMISAVYRGWRIAEDLKQNYGIEEYLEKPFRIGDVIAAAQRALATADARANAGGSQMPPQRDPETLSADAELALSEGIAAYRAGDLERAVGELERGVKIDPLSYRLRFHLALLYGKKGMIYEGIQELERAVDLNPKHFAALKNLAVLYEKAGFKHKAVELWERSMREAPDDATRTQIKEHLLQLL